MTRIEAGHKSDISTHTRLKAWVRDMAALCQPDTVYWCNGSAAEFHAMNNLMVESGTAIRLNEQLRPNSFLVRSDPADVARVEDRTFICSAKAEDAGPTNNWADPNEMMAKLRSLFNGSMVGRTMYVIPFCMGPVSSHIGKIGVQLTDSPYVVSNMHIMTRVGKHVLDALGDDGDFVPCMHSVGAPLPNGKKDVPWPCNSENKYICHFPDTHEIWSFGSGYGGNALLGKKCFALRIASVMARKQGWMAEHMLILKLTSPQGKVYHIAAAFPSACGKTNLAMMNPTLKGWKVQCVGDDIAWMKFHKDANGQTRLFAINPEAGFFGVAPGTSYKTNPNAMESIKENTIFTNVALSPRNDVWWEGMDDHPPDHAIDWRGNNWTPESETKAAHPNARFTAPARQCPVIADSWEDPDGVPIDAIVFGGRRASAQPLALQSFDWTHGTFLGSIMASEKTAAAVGQLGELRFDPMAMLPFCGYHMADYWQHWLDMETKGNAAGARIPKIFYVNWFLKDAKGKFLWPGFGENCRVLKWIVERCDGIAAAQETPIGNVPTPDSLELTGLNLPANALDRLLGINLNAWREMIPKIHEHYEMFSSKLPKALSEQLQALEKRLR